MVDSSPARSFTIDCSTCVMRDTAACDDCVVTFLCTNEPNDAVVIPLAELAALRAMGEVGLVPRLLHATDTR